MSNTPDRNPDPEEDDFYAMRDAANAANADQDRTDREELGDG